MNNKILTYSFLSHIRNKSTLIDGPIDIFVPLIKRVLSKLNAKGLFKGSNVQEIRNLAQTSYEIDFPIPVLVRILQKIAKEINDSNSTKFYLYGDGSYELRDYTFIDYEEIINNLSLEIVELKSFFDKFAKQYKDVDKPEFDDIISFINISKYSIAKYLGENKLENNTESGFAYQFISLIKNIPPLYELVKRIYLGSIISSFVEYKVESLSTNLELLLDTNFIVGLLDLNTRESTDTCLKLVEIAKKQGIVLTVLLDTIEETEALIRAKATHLNKSFLVSKSNPEDIYNASERRKLDRSDLERIADNLKSFLSSHKVSIVYEPSKYRNIAKYSKEFEFLKTIRNSERSALHDATAICYVKEKRKRPIVNFEEVNCWFLNNATNKERYQPKGEDNTKLYQPETIKVDDLLNILWLSNPGLNMDITSGDLANIGLNSLMSLALNRNLPSSKVISELENNIGKYSKQEISDEDIILLSKRISQNQIKNIDALNTLAEKDQKEFNRRLNEEAKKQKDIETEIYSKLSESIDILMTKTSQINTDIEKQNLIIKEKEDIEIKNKELQRQLNDSLSEITKRENLLRRHKREIYIENKVKYWRVLPILMLVIALMFFLFTVQFHYYSNKLTFIETIKHIISNDEYILTKFICGIFNLLITGIGIKLFYDRFLDTSKINNFKQSFIIPDELKDI